MLGFPRATVVPASAEEVLVPINALAVYSKGFILGAGNEVRVFEQSENNKEQFCCTRTIQLEDKEAEIISLVLSASEENIICATNTQQLYTMPLVINDLAKDQVPSQDYLVANYHTLSKAQDASITGLDCCAWKPLLGTL